MQKKKFKLISQIVPQCSPNFSRVFKPRAESRALFVCTPRSLSQEAKRARITSTFKLKLRNDLTIKCNNLTNEFIRVDYSENYHHSSRSVYGMV